MSKANTAEGGRSHPVRVIIGMDVGTSFSKVVIQFAHRHLAVPFDDDCTSVDSRFLVPTALSEMDDGRCLLGPRQDASRVHRDIKMPLIDRNRPFTNRDQERLTAFMALLLQHATRWARAEVERTEGSDLLEWAVNLGLPTASYNDELKEEYCNCALAAWQLANERDEPTLNQCRQVLESAARDTATTFGVFPEFVAQVSSYVQTPLGRDGGVHVMMDVGGGTLDVTVFMILPWEREDPVYPVLARKVEPLGTGFLVQHRWKDAKPGCNPPSPFRNLPLETETASLLGKTVKQLRRGDEPFYNYVWRCAGGTTRKADETAQAGLEWPGRLLLVGGGASVEIYRRVCRELESKEDWKYGLNSIELPRPGHLEMPKSGGMKWHRLAVAYGLSFDPDDIGRIRPPEEIEPVRPSYWKPTGPRPWVR